MLVSLKWLNDYVDLPEDIDVDEFAERLTTASAEVEGIKRIGDWDRELVKVGEVLSVAPHPNADRLSLVTVEYGLGKPEIVVCGAPNVAEGQRIAFARAGAELIDARNGKLAKLKRTKIRGVESSGMVLSERELGLSEEHEGILELPADAPVGEPLAVYLGDTVLDLHIWPNRADMMNMIGVSREVAALIGGELHLPDDHYLEGDGLTEDQASVEIGAPDLCARYVATIIDGVKIGPSPQWLQERLRAAGQRPINNVVDVTNYVMLEIGNPLHAFDADRIQGTIAVRLATQGERLTTLDGEDRELHGDTLLITDDDGPIALAGVMGGLSSEVSEATSTILLEAAQFDPASIRRTSTQLHLRSEASSRFERGLSPELAARASRRATKLLVEICGGIARKGVIDVYPRPPSKINVVLTRHRLDTVLGFQVPSDEVEKALQALGFEVGHAGSGEGEHFVVGVPWWRTDIAIPDDLTEEVVRITGYDRVPATTVRGRIPSYEGSSQSALRDDLKRALAAAGLHEVINYSLTTEEVLRRIQLPAEIEANPPLRLRNTLSSEYEVLRTSLRHSLLETVERNIRSGVDEVAIFEAARVYLPRRDMDALLPAERELITGVVSGAELDRWGTPLERELGFFDAKGVLEELGDRLGVAFEFTPHEEHGLLPGRTALLMLQGVSVGVIGEVHPATLESFDISQPVTLFELDIEALLALIPERREVIVVPRFPSVEQDLAVIVDEGVPVGALQSLIEESRVVAQARVFDIYRGEQLPEGKKSVAFAIRYQASERTLTTDDANSEQARILQRLEREYGAEQRA